MPHVIVKMYPGRTEEQKQRLADAITKDVMEVLGSKADSISVSIEDVDGSEWVEKVYRPDIESKPETVYKKPGYKVEGL